MNIIDHKLDSARWCPSDNYNERPNASINMLVVHNISLPPGKFGSHYIEDFFCNKLDCTLDPYFEQIKGLQVSAHLLIRRDGSILQFVPFNKRAWHAGQSSFKGITDCNDFSIGIELEGCDDVPYESPQYETLAQVSHVLMQAYSAITLERIVGHSDIAPVRKTDPGESFNWKKYKKQLMNEKISSSN